METFELISRCRVGDESALEDFVAQFSSPLYKLACAILADSAEAAEAVQDALVSALMNLKHYSGASALSTWVYAIALNECRARLRRRRVREKLNQMLAALWRAEAQTRPGPEEHLLRTEEDRRVWAAVQSLGDPHRIPIILRYYQQLSVREIAEILSLNEGTVHSRLNTARLRLHALLCDQPLRRENVVRQEV
jgi:RNA polymerase sigma-70 factor (ECF subfamily)